MGSWATMVSDTQQMARQTPPQDGRADFGTQPAGDTDTAGVPVLSSRTGDWVDRTASRMPRLHPALAFVMTLATGFAALALTAIAAGLLVTELLLDSGAIRSADESTVTWIVDQRGAAATDVSYIGSSLGGGLVLPVLAALGALVFALRRQWLASAFMALTLALESSVYRATTLVIERQRPDVKRLEDLPADASFPSGHTAASVAVYAGLALLITSRWTDGRLRAGVWASAIVLVLFVAMSRIYRGMHHPIDTLAGAAIGVGAIAVLVLACRFAGAASRRRAVSHDRAEPLSLR